jgi:predicted ABC-type ATPase
MINEPSIPKEIYIIAGPNGAGKTTFSYALIDEGVVNHFVNADEIAKEISHTRLGEHKDFNAGKLMLARLDSLSDGIDNFAFETTLSGTSYINRIRRWRSQGWIVNLYYLFVRDVSVSINRVAERVAHGGHDIPLEHIRRRYGKSLKNLMGRFITEVDYVECILNDQEVPITIFKAYNGKVYDHDSTLYPSFIEKVASS